MTSTTSNSNSLITSSMPPTPAATEHELKSQDPMHDDPKHPGLPPQIATSDEHAMSAHEVKRYNARYWRQRSSPEDIDDVYDDEDGNGGRFA
jgi:hypothetical protein